MKIGFYVMQCDWRAAYKSIYDYANANENVLGNESVIITTNKRPVDTLGVFTSRFKKVIVNDEDFDFKTDILQKRLEKIVEEEKLDCFFISYNGENFGVIPNNCKTLVQCVFNMSQPHGSHYFAISEYLAKKWNKKEFLPYIIDIPEPMLDIRASLDIPNDAIIFGRHGGNDTFHDIGGSYKAIIDIVNKDSNKYFVFLNTNQFYSHKQIIYLPPSFNQQYLSNFINSCDAMMHARNGETFGLAIGEFSWFNKPVITYGGTQDDYAHLEILGDQAIRYYDYNSLFDILKSWKKGWVGKYDAYRQFSSGKVMKKFKKEFLDK